MATVHIPPPSFPIVDPIVVVVVVARFSDSRLAMSTRELFGGACASTIPCDFTDLSRVFPIADNQEIFVRNDGSDATLVFEINETIDAASMEDACAIAFEDVCEANDATTYELLVVNARDDDEEKETSRTRGWMFGSATIAKGARARADDVDVWGALLRFPDVASDVLVWYMRPRKGGEEGDEANARVKPSDVERFRAGESVERPDVFERASRTFTLRDRRVFGVADTVTEAV